MSSAGFAALMLNHLIRWFSRLASDPNSWIWGICLEAPGHDLDLQMAVPTETEDAIR